MQQLLLKHPENQYTALVRPGTAKNRYQEFEGKCQFEYLDLADVKGIKNYLDHSNFDLILHIGALRGGRKADRETYYKANVGSTEQMVDFCIRTSCRLIFCSSVGVFGAIPSELPANAQSRKNPDNYYHYTKIEAEKIIGKAIFRGLQAGIIRPSITYGVGDFGFPYQMVKMVAKYRFPLINRRIWIHLCHIDALVAAFMYMVENEIENGLTLNVADREPVQLNALVDFISRQLHKKNYPRLLKFDRHLFALGEKISRLVKNELFISRFELISKSWFYDVQAFYAIMEKTGGKIHYTIPGLKITIEDYLKKNGNPHHK